MIIFAATNEIARISRFGLVGIFNTLLDFTIFNTLSSKRIGWSKIQANTASTTVAMISSFVINRGFVFGGQGNPLVQALLFFGVTAFGLYVLQNGVIYLLTKTWKWPRAVTEKITRSHHIPLESDFVLKNSAKIVGTVVSFIWNYVLYGRIVFRVNS